jgi:hypothetical protein
LGLVVPVVMTTAARDNHEQRKQDKSTWIHGLRV